MNKILISSLVSLALILPSSFIYTNQANAQSTRIKQNTPTPAKVQKNRLIEIIETELKKPLSQAQTNQILKMSDQAKLTLEGIQGTFVKEAAKITGLSETQIKPLMPKVWAGSSNANAIIQKLEKTMGKPLTSQQRSQIVAADAKMRRAMQPIRNKFVQDIAKISGLTMSQIYTVLPRVTS